VLPLLNNFARIPVCGLIAHYNDKELPPGPNCVPLLMVAIPPRMAYQRNVVACNRLTEVFYVGYRPRQVQRGLIQFILASGFSGAPLVKENRAMFFGNCFY
jgi:NADPH-dependent curcumin reductase CurA